MRAALQDDQTGVFFLPGQSAMREVEAIAPGSLERGLFPFIRRFDPVVIDAGVWGMTTLAPIWWPVLTTCSSCCVPARRPQWMSTVCVVALASAVPSCAALS